MVARLAFLIAIEWVLFLLSIGIENTARVKAGLRGNEWVVIAAITRFVSRSVLALLAAVADVVFYNRTLTYSASTGREDAGRAAWGENWQVASTATLCDGAVVVHRPRLGVRVLVLDALSFGSWLTGE